MERPPSLVDATRRALGVWEIEISKSGRLDAYTPEHAAAPRQAIFSAKVSATADQLTIGTVPVCATKGVYNWKVPVAH